MEKYKIELSKEQLVLISNCLEDISRFASGQIELYHTLNSIFGSDYDTRNECIEKLKEVREVIFPDMHPNSSLSYNSTDFIGNTYQIYRTIIHTLTVEKGIQNAYSSPTLPSGNMGTIKIEKI